MTSWDFPRHHARRAKGLRLHILLYGLNSSPELTGIGKYTGEMASWLARRGHHVDVVTAPPYYPAWKIRPDYRNAYTTEHPEPNLTIHRCPLYVPATPPASSASSTSPPSPFSALQ